MFGLNLTWQFQFSPERLSRLTELNPVGELLAKMFPWGNDTLHDPTLVVYLLRPDLFTFRSDAEPRYITVEASEDERRQHRHGECLFHGEPHEHKAVDTTAGSSVGKGDIAKGVAEAGARALKRRAVPKPVNIAEKIKHEGAYELVLDLIRAYSVIQERE